MRFDCLMLVSTALGAFPELSEPNRFTDLRFERIGRIADKGYVDAAIGEDGSGLKIANGKIFGDTCRDEYFGLRALPKQKILDLLNSIEYKTCGKPDPDNLFDALPADIEDYEIDPRLACDDKVWVRLDCSVTKKNGKNPFIVSRVAKKPTFTSLHLVVPGKLNDSSHFRDRVRCEAQNVSKQQQYNECQWLLQNFLRMEQTACTMDPSICVPKKTKFREVIPIRELPARVKVEPSAPLLTRSVVSDKSSGPLDVDSDSTSTESTGDEIGSSAEVGTVEEAAAPTAESGNELNATTIGLIVGGVLFLLIAGVVVFKLMGDGGNKQDGAQRRKGKKESRRNRRSAERSAESEASEPESQTPVDDNMHTRTKYQQ